MEKGPAGKDAFCLCALGVTRSYEAKRILPSVSLSSGTPHALPRGSHHMVSNAGGNYGWRSSRGRRCGRMAENAAIRRERRMDRLLTLSLMVQVVSWVMRGMTGEGEERRRCRAC